jgi:type II secretory pathway predicted ATPase ExeA
LTRIEEELARSSKIAVAKSLAVDKRRTSLPSLIEAMFYDLTPGDRSQIKIPKQPERRGLLFGGPHCIQYAGSRS